MKFEEKLLNLRRQAGYSQEELAEKLNVSRQAISRWEQGSAMPDAVNLLQISKLFCVSVDYLLHDEYTSDRDIPAVQSGRSELDSQWHNRVRLIAGGALSVLCTVGLLVLGILGSGFAANISEAVPIEPGQTSLDVIIPETTVRGLFPFLNYHHLSWLFWLCAAGVAVGLAVLFWPGIRRRFK